MSATGRAAWTATALLVLVVPFSTAQEEYRPIVVSIDSAVDLPLPPDSNLFQAGGDAGAGVGYAFPFFPPLSAGIVIAYHLGPMWHADLVWSGRLGVGLRMSPLLSIDVHGEYRRYRKLYHLVGIGLGVDLRMGRVE